MIDIQIAWIIQLMYQSEKILFLSEWDIILWFYSLIQGYQYIYIKNGSFQGLNRT